MFEIQHTSKSTVQLEIGERVKLPTIYGDFEFIPFRETSSGKEDMVLIKGYDETRQPVLVRVHSSCATGDLFGSLRCDCGEQLHQALRSIEAEGCGVLIYLQQEGRGIGLMEKIKAYKLQENNVDTVDANLTLGHQPDERDYKIAAEILKHLNIKQVRLLTNNPAKQKGLEDHGIEVEECVPIRSVPNQHNAFYLKTKQEKMGHLLGQLNLETYEDKP